MLAINPTNAPVWELSLSAVAASRTIYSPYFIRDVHQGIAADYPSIERQAPFAGFGTHPTPPAPLAQPELVFNSVATPRWWFISEDGHKVIQLQEDFVAANWRRLSKSPAEAKYPGFAAQLGEFERWISLLQTVDSNRPEEFPFPNPVRCEISYENMIPLQDSNGDALRFRDVLAVLQGDPRPPQKVLGFQASWFSYLPDQSHEIAPEMQVNLQGGVSISDMDGNFVRIQIVCRSPVETWEDCSAFFKRAHSACIDELFKLTTEAVHATWKA